MGGRKQIIDTINLALASALADVHTATIARVERVGATTIDCQPVINRVVRGESIPLPLFVEVPPVFLQGGSSYTAHPVAVGDYCLLIVCERCFDRWYDGQDEQRPLEARMHDYSDGLALVGINPRDAAIPIPQETTTVGMMRLGVTDPGDFMALAGKVLSELERVKSDLAAQKAVFDAHVHPGVLSGGASTGPSPAPYPEPSDPASVASDWVKAE